MTTVCNLTFLFVQVPAIVQRLMGALWRTAQLEHDSSAASACPLVGIQPSTRRNFAHIHPADLLGVKQAYWCSIAAACLSLALLHAGTADLRCRKLIYHQVRRKMCCKCSVPTVLIHYSLFGLLLLLAAAGHQILAIKQKQCATS